MIRRTILATAVLTAAMLGWTTAAQSNALEIGGKTSATGVLSVGSSDPDGGNNDTTTLVIGAAAAYTTPGARFEFGAGITILGLILPDDADADTVIYSPTAQARINSNPLGPEENVLIYGGAVAGVGIIRSDSPFIGDDEVGIFGPKAGVEFYVSPKAAVQIEDQFVWDTEGGTTNNLTIGFKFLFN